MGGPGAESVRKAKAYTHFVCVIEKPLKISQTNLVISFSNSDLEGLNWPHNDAIVLQLVVANRPFHRVLIDTRAFVDLMCYEAYEKLCFGPKKLKAVARPIYGFSGMPSEIEGMVDLLVMMGEETRSSTVMATFMVARVASAYNVILGRPGLNSLGVVASAKHVKVKLPIENGGGECRASLKEVRECYTNFVKANKNSCLDIACPTEIIDARDERAM
ncbi:uncharacterized protein LOC122062385 [Macadamia integrifolia]|uniref:uncharacterized protein LOC122062385 n=1 Tax=Macadamia integrifolia TaxID=60698 RepID=UPI001C4FCB95|nr:uncharacterized protein LOC122062385 [Macadamia integrifolia]